MKRKWYFWFAWMRENFHKKDKGDPAFFVTLFCSFIMISGNRQIARLQLDLRPIFILLKERVDAKYFFVVFWGGWWIFLTRVKIVFQIPEHHSQLSILFKACLNHVLKQFIEYNSRERKVWKNIHECGPGWSKSETFDTRRAWMKKLGDSCEGEKWIPWNCLFV